MHRPVLENALVNATVGPLDGQYVDATFGRGGHTRMLLSRLNKNASVIAFDKDPEAILYGQTMFDDPRLRLVHADFARMSEVLAAMNVCAVDGVMADLGVSSNQIDTPQRGFSFMHDAPLDMRMDPSNGISAKEWIADATYEEMRDVFSRLGEERYAGAVAAGIIAARERNPITTTHELVSIIANAQRNRDANKHPATRVFLAIRMHINNELDALLTLLSELVVFSKVGTRVALLSFHSLEDRIVKQWMHKHKQRSHVNAHFPHAIAAPKGTYLRVFPKKKASATEIQSNPRARSAILRSAEILALQAA